MEPFAIAVKAFIVHDEKILTIRRRSNDPHKPGVWDIPGGRLDPGEDTFAGLLREAREEVGLSIKIEFPLRVHSFTRDDGQQITMIVFLCTTENPKVTLSEEHSDARWMPPESVKTLLDEHFHDEVSRYVRFFQKSL